MSASASAPAGIDSQKNAVTYDAANVADGLLETTWRVPGDGVGQFLTLEFASPIRISEIRLLPGYAKIDPHDGTDRFTQNRRVQRVRLEFSDGSSVEAVFADHPWLQAVDFSPIVSSFVRVVILQTREPAASDGRDYTPISEIVVIGQAQQSSGIKAGDTLVIQAAEGVRLREQPDATANAVFERPLLVTGSTVRAIAQRGDWWQVQTPEGVAGWLLLEATNPAAIRSNSATAARRFADGARVVVHTPKGLGIPLRAQPLSTAAKIVDVLPDGSSLNVIGELGDWLRLRTAAGTEGWGRWYYDGAQYLYPR